MPPKIMSSPLPPIGARHHRRRGHRRACRRRRRPRWSLAPAVAGQYVGVTGTGEVHEIGNGFLQHRLFPGSLPDPEV